MTVWYSSPKPGYTAIANTCRKSESSTHCIVLKVYFALHLSRCLFLSRFLCSFCNLSVSFMFVMLSSTSCHGFCFCHDFQAAENGKEETVDCLVNAGARLDINDANGDSALRLVGIDTVHFDLVVISF